MPDAVKRWTREEVLALPDDGNRYELLDGELLVSPSPAPRHQMAVWSLSDRIQPYVEHNGFGRTGLAPADLDLRSGQSLQPDLFVVSPLPPGERLTWADFGIPLLVVEVLSPSTAYSDRHRKRRRFQQSGIAEYWIVDTDARLIERWHPQDERPETLTDRIEWQPDAELPPLTIDLEAYFREIWGGSGERLRLPGQ